MSEKSKEERIILRNESAAALLIAEEALASLIASFGTERVSAAHPKSGISCSLQTLKRIRHSIQQARV